MCQVSDKIKLCSCKTKDVERLKNYWVLHREENTVIQIVGEVFFPPIIDEEITAQNIDILLKLLNACDIFDVEMQLKNNDILELHLTLPKEYVNIGHMRESVLVYSFKYRAGKWSVSTYSPQFEFDIIQQGKIKNAFRKAKY